MTSPGHAGLCRRSPAEAHALPMRSVVSTPCHSCRLRAVGSHDAQTCLGACADLCAYVCVCGSSARCRRGSPSKQRQVAEVTTPRGTETHGWFFWNSPEVARAPMSFLERDPRDPRTRYGLAPQYVPAQGLCGRWLVPFSQDSAVARERAVVFAQRSRLHVRHSLDSPPLSSRRQALLIYAWAGDPYGGLGCVEVGLPAARMSACLRSATLAPM